MARHGKAWQGMARHGKAWQGMARHSLAIAYIMPRWAKIGLYIPNGVYMKKYQNWLALVVVCAILLPIK
jgi:hypothetical protein